VWRAGWPAGVLQEGMAVEKTKLEQRIESGSPIVLAEISPPTGADPAPVREAARRFAGKVHALGLRDNRDRVCMSALAAASLVAREGVEPILHVVTRDRNRIALFSEYLGAEALGIRNVLCTSGTHQTLGRFRAARNVFDIDSIQLLRAYADLSAGGAIVGESELNGGGPACLGAVASPLADPMELQLARLAKKVSAGAVFLVTDPVFDVERFTAWLSEVSSRGLHERAAIVVGIRPLTDAQAAEAFSRRRPSPRVPEPVLGRIASGADRAAQRAAGIDVAVETIGRLAELDGVRGFQIGAERDVDAALAVIEQSGFGID